MPGWRWPRLLTIVALAALVIPLPVAAPNAATGDDDQQCLPEKVDLKNPNLGSHLNGLVAEIETVETPARQAAARAPLHREDSVAVTVYLSG